MFCRSFVTVDVQLLTLFFRAEGSSKIQARIEQQSVRATATQPPAQFRAPTKPGAGAKSSPSKDNPSPEPQLDDIKRGEPLHVLPPLLPSDHSCFSIDFVCVLTLLPLSPPPGLAQSCERRWMLLNK